MPRSRVSNLVTDSSALAAIAARRRCRCGGQMPSNRQRRHWTAMSRACGVLAIVLIAAGCASSPTRGASTEPHARSPEPVLSDTPSSKPAATDAPTPRPDLLRDSERVIEVGEGPEGALVTNDSVWIANHRGG